MEPRNPKPSDFFSLRPWTQLGDPKGTTTYR